MIWRALQVAAVVAFSSLAFNGVPILRHDWHWPIDSQQATYWASTVLSGWRLDGIGSPNPYPTEYLYGSFCATLVLLLGSQLGLGAFLFGLAAGAACIASYICRRFHAGGPVGPALTFVFLFNPWCYNEVVAGHLFMVVSAAGIAFLLALLCDEQAEDIQFAVAAVLASAQFQLFLLTFPAFVYALLRRRAWIAAATWAAVVAPLVFGILIYLHRVASTPIAPDWEFQQSVVLTNGLFLSGYFARYADVYSNIAKLGMFGICSVAALSAFAKDKRALFPFLVAIVSLVAAAAYRGPLAIQFTWMMAHFKAVGLYRELYDLLAYVLAAYLLLLAIATARFRWLRYPALLASLILPICWLTYPPWHYFVRAAEWPELNLPRGSYTRFALLPPLQPVSYMGRGSGIDPDTYAHGGISPLNEYIPQYPEGAALLKFIAYHDATQLEALGVGPIIGRSGVKTTSWNENPFTIGIGASQGVRTTMPPRVVIASAVPFVTESAVPTVALLGADLMKPALLSADFTSVSGVHPIDGSGVANVDTRTGWSDAHFAFLLSPKAAEPLGGIATASTVPLSLRGRDPWFMVYVHGVLRAGKQAVRANGDVRWIRVPTPHRTFVCRGLCVLIASAPARSNLPLDGMSISERRVQFRRPLPWLITAGPFNGAGFIIVRERYDRWWIALDGARILRHTPVNHTFNGWYLVRGAGRVIFLNIMSGIQFVLIVIAFIVTGFVLLRFAVKKR